MNETTLTGESMNIVADNIEKLKEIFPDVFCEDKVDFEKLQEVLGEYVEDKQERYNFTWNGKSKALRLSQTPSTGTLRPCPEESKNWDTTENLYIEGDNLEVLKLLQKTYHSKIKMIYIDPPYNTGGDFVYPDDFTDNLENYLNITRQIDKDGNKITPNVESNGRYHTNWLNMMYSRLRLARNLLAEDGIIFISIDDNEVFGEDNFVSQLIWHSRQNVDSRSLTGASNDHEYVLCYFKYQGTRLRGKEIDKLKYSNPDNDPRGPWMSSPMDGIATADRRPNLHYTIVNPETGLTYDPSPENGWRFQKSTVDSLIQEERIIWPKNPNSKPRFKRYLNELQSEYTGFSSVLNTDFTSKGTRELRDLMGMETVKFPKPTSFIKILVEQGIISNEGIILDFFSGSATTADAIMQINAEDNGSRKFIMVQLPELCEEKSDVYKAGYKNICEIGKERIRRAGDKIKEEIESGNQQLKLGEEPKKVPDIGFKVLKLDSSNIKKWNPNVDNIEESLQQSLLNFVEGRTELDMVYEIMLKYGIDLTYPIETININGKKVYSIGFGQLMICLDNNITTDIAQAIIEHKKQNEVESMVVVFKDNGFANDSVKTNIKEILKVADIKDFVTV